MIFQSSGTAGKCMGFSCIHKYYVLLNVSKIYFKLKRLLSKKYICVVVKLKVSFFSVKYIITLYFCVTYIIRVGREGYQMCCSMLFVWKEEGGPKQ